jgi:bifunctional non-homologous end joining protein LigD
VTGSATDRHELRFGRYTVPLSNPGKVLFPGDGITKLEVVEHYRAVAPLMLPHAGGRPLSLQRFPDGIGAGGFFQKNAGRHYPEWIERVSLPKSGGTIEHVVAQRAADLVWLANQGTVTFHAGLAPVAHPERPDRLVFDLDPSVDDFGMVRDGARLLREVLDDLGLVPYVMTTGSRGLHVVVPVSGNETFDELRPVVASVARLVVDREPEMFTVDFRKAARGRRVFVDHFRNAYGQTAVCPWSLRAKARAPVAVPVDWDELDDPALSGGRYTIADVPALLDRPDPWSGMARRARATTRARQRLARLQG